MENLLVDTGAETFKIGFAVNLCKIAFKTSPPL